jgi:hypothetical protein
MAPSPPGIDFTMRDFGAFGRRWIQYFFEPTEADRMFFASDGAGIMGLSQKGCVIAPSLPSTTEAESALVVQGSRGDGNPGAAGLHFGMQGVDGDYANLALAARTGQFASRLDLTYAGNTGGEARGFAGQFDAAKARDRDVGTVTGTQFGRTRTRQADIRTLHLHPRQIGRPRTRNIEGQVLNLARTFHAACSREVDLQILLIKLAQGQGLDAAQFELMDVGGSQGDFEFPVPIIVIVTRDGAILDLDPIEYRFWRFDGQLRDRPLYIDDLGNVIDL